MLNAVRASVALTVLASVLVACGGGAPTATRTITWQRVQREFASVGGVQLAPSAITESCTAFPPALRGGCAALKKRDAVALTPYANLFGSKTTSVGAIIVFTTAEEASAYETSLTRPRRPDDSTVVLLRISNVLVSYRQGPSARRAERAIAELRRLTSG